MKIRNLVSATALLAGLAPAFDASAVVIRDDRADASYLTLGADPRYASVGRVSGATGSSGFSASGTLIGGHYVLTAGHVTDDATSLSVSLGGQTFSASSWYTNPKWSGNVLSGYDIGIMYFAQDLSVATGISAANLYRGTSELGKTGTTVGFGMTGTGLTGATTFDAQKRAGQNTIDATRRTGNTNGILLADFDSPTGAADNSSGSATPLDLESMIAPGDSGGAMFLDIGGVDYLAGVLSFGWGYLDGNPDSDYGDVEGIMRVSSYLSWIDSIVGGGTGKGGGGKGGGGPKHLLLVEVPAPATLAVFGFGLAL